MHLIEIIEYSEKYRDEIKTLNYEWLQKYFRVERGDEISLSDPKKEIIDKGGFVFYAKFGEEIVGTVSLIKRSAAEFELGKMAVTEKVQGLSIGKKLLEHAIDFARRRKIKKLVLYSNTLLKPAVHLYHKYGFKEVELESGLYERADIKMEKILF